MTSPKSHAAVRHGAARHWLALATAVLLLAAAFRLVALAEVPPGLAQDEVLDADIAMFIRQGERAIFFRHGYGHEPLYHYLAAPFAPLYGDNLLAVRLPSVYFGLLLVAATMRWAKRDYGPLAAIVAGAGLAVSWWPVIFSRIGIRPILLPLLLVGAAWFWPLRAERITKRGLLAMAAAGVSLGLAMYSYTAARVAPLIPIGVLALGASNYFLLRRSSEPGLTRVRAQMLYALLILATCLLVYLPLGLTLRANPELQQRLDQLGGPLEALRAGDARPVVKSTLATLGVFSFTGDPRWTYSLPNRPIFDLLTALLFYAGLALVAWRWRRPTFALLPVWLAVMLLPSALSPDAPSTVRLIGALPVVYLLPGLAAGEVARRLLVAGGGRPAVAQWGAATVLALLLALNAGRTLRDGFGSWPDDPETRLRYQTTIRDIGRQWQADGESAPPVVAEVFYEPIDAATLRRDLGRDPAARWVQTAGVAGALVWPAGQSSSRLYVPEYAPLDGGLAGVAGLADDPLYRSPNTPSFAVYALPESPPVAAWPARMDFGAPPVIRWEGFSPGDPLQSAPGGNLELFTSWEALDSLPADLAIFVHLIDSAGAIVAQHDGLDAAAETISPGDRILQRHVLSLPVQLAGDYQLVMGLYRRDSGERLPNGEIGDAVRLLECRAEADAFACSLPKTR